MPLTPLVPVEASPIAATPRLPERLDYWSYGVLEFRLTNKSFQHSIIPTFQLLHWHEIESLGSGFERITPRPHHSSIPVFLRLPTATQGAVELHHEVELRSPGSRQQQLLVEELLVSDQDFQIVGQSGVVTQSRELRSICQRRHTRFQLGANPLDFFNADESIGDLPEAVLRGSLVLSDRLFEASLCGLVV